MGEPTKDSFEIPPEQQMIRDKCIHPSGTFVEFPKEEIEQSITARFEKIVRTYPDQLAVKMGDRALTYDELNHTANCIAHAILEKRGSVAEPVVLFFEHGIDVITAILGGLKAGKFYVAVDVSFPAQRIDQILEDCRAGLILTNDRHADLAHRLARSGCDVMNVGLLDTSVIYDNPGVHLSPGSLASILYTSGSTAKPKGIAHSHRSQLHTVMVNTNEARICYQDKLTLIHSVGFGSAQAHLFQSLLNGASLCSFDLKSEGVHRLAKWLNEERITVYHSPPAVFRQLAEAMLVQEKLSGLRLIRLSGAPVTRLDYDLYKKAFVPGALLQGVMNSTEANVICSFITDGSFSFPESGSPAGYAVTDKTIFLLDDDGCEVEPGEVGEIAVRSRYLPPSDWKSADLNAINLDSGSNGEDERLCVTGDRGLRLPDGFYIHLGRRDSMVKIRGYRVELSEIETALLEQPTVKEAALVAWNNEAGEKYLVGYVVPVEYPPPLSDQINARLRTKLPEYMVPTVIVFLDALPLTNGKLDWTKLPRPDSERRELAAPYIAPQSEVEQTLTRIWEEVIGLDRVGIHDNFFDLGGHSLAAMRVISQVLKRFQLEIPLRSLLESPTVAEMAKVIVEYQGKRIGNEELERVLAELEAITEEEAQKLLAEKHASGERL